MKGFFLGETFGIGLGGLIVLLLLAGIWFFVFPGSV